MDLEDRRIRRGRRGCGGGGGVGGVGGDETAPMAKIICHERKNNRNKTAASYRRHRKTTAGKTIRCPDKGTTTNIQKLARINPLMTVLMSSRSQHDQPTGNMGDEGGIRTERTPVIAYRTVVLELPEHLRYRPHMKSTAPVIRGPAIPKYRVPDPEKLKINLRW